MPDGPDRSTEWALPYGLSRQSLPHPHQGRAMIRIPARAGTHRIDRRIYGQFAEHLGRCIYEGIWVGEDSPIPHRNGIRSDVIAALRAIRVPLVRWPGGCF